MRHPVEQAQVRLDEIVKLNDLAAVERVLEHELEVLDVRRPRQPHRVRLGLSVEKGLEQLVAAQTEGWEGGDDAEIW